MTWLNSQARRGLRSSTLLNGTLLNGAVGLAVAAAAITITYDGADARHHHGMHITYVHARHGESRGESHAGRRAEARVHRHAHEEEYSPPSASIVVDGNSGAVLEAANPDALRHPASLTKVMTLFLLFERLDSGRMQLDTQMKVTEHAAEQDPTKLDLKPGSTISVEDAIKGIVTRSANDAAVVIAENIGGDEPDFAKMMTAKAHALGMSRTNYVNASGLPDDDQITTARDQALLGRAIQDRFPRYYKYFSTESFVFHGEAIHGHNHLLGSVQGVDGIKTGFTRASGFNLLTSVHRDGHFIVAAVMGGHSAFERDSHMRDLIGEHIQEASLRRTAPMIADAGGDAQPVAFAKAPMASAPMASAPVVAAPAVAAPVVAHADPAQTSSVPVPTPAPAARIAAANAAVNGTAGTNDMRPMAGSSDPIRPLLVRTVTFRTAPMQTAAMSPMPALVAVPTQAPTAPAQVTAQVTPQITAQVAAPVAAMAPAPQPVAAPVREAMQLPVPMPAQQVRAEQPRTEQPRIEAPQTVVASADPAAAIQAAAPAPAPVRTVAAPVAAPVAPVAAPVVQPVAAPVIQASAAPEMAQQVTPLQQAALNVSAHGGWLIQIGAFDDEDQAKQHLSDAQTKVHTALAAADPFTERVQKGDTTLYRARFAGFDKTTAETACKELKRSDFQCMALKD